MSYCINPNCSHRQNPEELESCQSCGTKLLINERYEIVKPLRVGPVYNSEVFEVQDFHEQGTLKLLKSLANKPKDSKLAELFEKEAQVLIWLSSDWQTHPGIPKVKPDGYFAFGLGNGFRKLQCLVMDKIEGQNLEQWLENNPPLSQEQAVNWLRQLVEILNKVHRQGLWHRDIKPSNIMLKPDGQLVLIDFGAVGVEEIRIISAEYTPPEQFEGKTVLQSDLFALGRTFVYLLTNTPPNNLPKNPDTEQLIWRNLVPKISPNLAQLIDDLMATLPENRPQNTQEVWQLLQVIDNSDDPELPDYNTTSLINYKNTQLTQVYSKSKTQQLGFKVKVLYAGAATLILGLAAYIVFPCQLLGNLKPCIINENFSFGEKILVPGSPRSEKADGVKAFSKGNYNKAIKSLEQARKNQINDPETLIYLNNARIEAKKAQSYTIAVAVPLKTSSEGLNSGLEILRGVAHAINEFNQSQKELGIKVLIADDANNSKQAKQIAEALVNQQDVLGVVGHFTSDLTLAAAEVYQQNQLVFISPTSTAEDLSKQGKDHQPNFFFRTVSSDGVTAKTLAKYLSQQPNQQRIVLLYNPDSKYSNSLRNQFVESVGKVVDELDLSTINPEQAIEKSTKQGANVLVLFPNSQNIILDNTTDLINANHCRYPMVGGDALYSPKILKVGKAASQKNCLVVAVPWHSMDSPNQEFPQVAQKLWGGQVSWRTAFAYDATRALIKAITQSKLSGKTVQQVLADSNFQVTGATGRIRFQANGDRQEPNIKLVKLALDKQSKPQFLPLTFSQGLPPVVGRN